MNDHSHSRRGLLKFACTALAAIPVMSIAGNAFAANNATMRKALNYQDSPKDGKTCASCLNFVPGASASAAGGCKIIGGDTEISPNGYCVGFVVKK